MTAFLIILGLASLALSIGALVGGAKWAARQVNADDCMLDWDDLC